MAGPLDLERQFTESQSLAHVGSWEWDVAQERVWWSDEMCRIAGRTPGYRPTFQEMVDHVHPDDRAEHAPDIAAGTGDFEYRIVRPGGVVRVIHGYRRARYDAAGAITHLHGVVQDVTERSEAQRERDEALDLLESAFAHGAVGMSIVGVDGRWLTVNEAMCRMTGWSADELLGGTFQDITHPDDLEADLAQLRRTLAGEIDDYQMEKRYRTRAGGWVWVLLSVALVRDRHGEPRHFVGQIQDISDRKRAEERLREAETEARRERDHVQTIIATMREGYALTIDGEVTAVNQALCEMLGYREHELLGTRPPYPFWPAELTHLIAEAKARVLTSGEATVALALTRRDGTPFEAELTVRAARGAAGEIIGLVHTWHDVSDRNRLQRELERRARTDSLTGLDNRYVLEEALTQEARRHARGQTLALVLLDLDCFKQVNDAHGHPVGDAVLVETARRLTSVVRGGEVLARVGGEEFAWLLPDCDGVGARAAAERARAVVADDPFPDAGPLTMSAGIAVMEIPCDADEIYELADRALYDAKQAGRDRARCRVKPGEQLDASGRRAGDLHSAGSIIDLFTGTTA